MNLEEITGNVFIQNHDLSIMGCKLGRVVTIIRLENRNTFLHSTADFSPEQIAAIREVGEPEMIFEATNFHDTTARAGREAFGKAAYLVPNGFPRKEELGALAIDQSEPGNELEFIKIEGIPKLNEYAVFHRPTKTLIIADLFFNLDDSVGAWTKWFLKTTMKLDSYPGQSAYLRRFIEDEIAYRDSIQKIADLDFDRIIVGHGVPILDNAKQTFKSVLLAE